MASTSRLTSAPLGVESPRLAQAPGGPPGRPLRDNPLFILLAIGLLAGALAALILLVDRS